MVWRLIIGIKLPLVRKITPFFRLSDFQEFYLHSGIVRIAHLLFANILTKIS